MKTENDLLAAAVSRLNVRTLRAMSDLIELSRETEELQVISYAIANGNEIKRNQCDDRLAHGAHLWVAKNGTRTFVYRCSGGRDMT